MLQITKQGNSIVVEGLNHYFYPYNGTLEVPCNSVITVVDEGDIVLFRSASNYDVLFSAKIDEITINGQSVTKDNVGEVFGALSNVSSGGGGLTPEQEEKLNNAVQTSDYNADKATQTTIDEAQNTEINKIKGDIEGKQDIIQDLNAIREGADLGKTALQEETDPVWTAEKGNYYTKTEVDTSLESKANKTEIPTVPTNVSAFTNDAGYLTEHQSLNDYYTKSEVDTSLESKANKSEIPTVPTNVSAFTNDAGYLTEHQSLNDYYTKTESDGKYATQVVVNEEIEARIREIRDVKATLESKADKSEIPTVPTNVSAFTNDAGYLTEHQSLDNYYTKTEVNTSLEAKADKTEIPSLNGYATEQWVGQQGYLTEHQPLKTINGETIVGNGNIEISSGEETDPIWNAEKVNYYTKTEVNSSLESKANKSEIPTVPTNVSAFTNDAGYLTQHQTLKTINGETIVGDGNIEIQGGGSDVYSVIITDFTFNSYVKFYATKNSVPLGNAKLSITAIGTSDNNISRVEKSFTLYTKDDGYVETPKLDLIYYHFIIEMYDNNNLVYKTTLGNFYNIQRQLISGTSIKTINGESIFGSGDIVISGGGEETDPIWNAEKVNYYTKTEVNSSLESKADKTEIPTVPTNVSAFTNDAGYLTEHQTLKTINGQTIVGNGNIEITGGEETDPVWTAEKGNYYTKSEIDGIVGNVNNALSEIING